jgi:diphosphomevalonate decarboxylase
MQLSSSWRSPSNIAIIKYWGKHGIQLPRNPSLSFTLSACHTDMFVRAIPNAGNPSLEVFYDGTATPAFIPKIQAFFNRLSNELPWLKNSSVHIDSINTFPHSAGIASSASAMSALALCLVDIDDELNEKQGLKDENWWNRVSEFARLGSGSACRSLFPVAALWGKSEYVKESSDQYAIPWVDQLSPLYHTFQDAILVVNAGEKTISSTAGHDFMNHIPYADARYLQAGEHLKMLIEVMQSESEIGKFITICESEALQLHALMMMGPQPYMLMQPDTLSIIKEIWSFRKESGIPVCFTLDAGPNVHLLYPHDHKTEVHDFIKSNLLQYCQDGIFILDEVGNGPVKLS